MNFELKILGSASATPVLGRHPTSQLLTVGAAHYLIDCGEGTQWQMLALGVRPHHLRTIFISHLHGDHYFGLFGLLGTMHLQGRTAPLTIVGPPGLDEVLTTQARVADTRLNYPLTFVRVDTRAADEVYADEHLRVSSLPMRHRIPCAGYLFSEQPRRANLIKARLPEALTPTELARLAAGENLPATPAHAAVHHADVSAPPPPPRRYAFCSDTLYTPALAGLVRGADLLYHEATFLHEHAERAAQTHHSTGRQAAQLAEAAGVGHLLLGHFSSRYKSFEALLAEARAVFPNTDLAAEGLTVRL